jgi:hypothetical protein
MLEAAKIIGLFWVAMILTYGIIAIVLIVARNRGLKVIEAFDKISLLSILEMMRGLDVSVNTGSRIIFRSPSATSSSTSSAPLCCQPSRRR